MLTRKIWALVGCLSAVSAAHAQPSAANNDGFQRRNGQMQIVRNGQPRPMTRDAHLPTGSVVTKDGFIVGPTGQRTELQEGEGCDLRGRPVRVLTTANGTLALGSPVQAAAPAARGQVLSARSVLNELFGQREDDEDGNPFKFKKEKKRHGKGHGKGHGRWKDDDDD